jgi:hypothetical protein
LARAVGLLLRVLSNLTRHLSTALTMLYDVVIFLPLIIERVVRSRRGAGPGPDIEVPRHGGFRKTG